MPKKATLYRENTSFETDHGLTIVNRLGIGSGLNELYEEEVALSTPLFYFILNQTGASNPVDSSGNGLAAVLDAPYSWGEPGPVSGYTALGLSGGRFQTSRVALSGDQTRVAFVKLTSTKNTSTYEGDAALTVMGDTHAETWDSFGVTDGKVNYRRFNNSTWQSFSGTDIVNDGNWHMIAMTYDSSTRAVVLYTDGTPDGGGTVSAHQNYGGILQYGRGYSALDNFDGTLGHLSAWDRVLTSGEIYTLYAAAIA